MKGIPNRRTMQVQEEVAKHGITPLDFLLKELRDETLPNKDRHDAAVAAAPYIHSKMPTAIVTPPAPFGPVSEDDESLLNQYINGLHDEADES